MTLDHYVAMLAAKQETIEVAVSDLLAWSVYQKALLVELRELKDLLWDHAVREAFPDPKPLDGA